MSEQENGGLGEVRPQEHFELPPLDAYLRQHLPGYAGQPELQQFDGGVSNPTFLLHSGDRGYVLRKKPRGVLLPTAHMIEREYRLYRALQDSDVPVPKVHLLCEDTSVIGTAFFVMEYVKGRCLRDPALPDFTLADRAALYADMNRVLAALHAVDVAARGLADYGKPGNYFRRQIERWTRQYLAAKTREIEAMDRLIEWLPQHVPDDDSTSLVHGDYQLYNMMLHPSEPKIVALLDWELSTLGHPLSDLAYNCTKYHSEQATTLGPGVPSEQEYVAMYCEHTGRREIPDWNFYLAFAFFRSASIGQGVYMRALKGNSTSPRAITLGADAVQYAIDGWRVARGG